MRCICSSVTARCNARHQKVIEEDGRGMSKSMRAAMGAARSGRQSSEYVGAARRIHADASEGLKSIASGSWK